MRKSLGTALITGGAVRIGRSIALKLSSSGYDIALHYNGSKQQALETKKNIQKNKVRCEIFVCDLSDKDEVLNLISRVRKWAPNLNVLINSASIFEKSNISNWNLEHY